MSTEQLVVREIIVALVGATAGSMILRSPLVEPYKAIGTYSVAGLTAFWCLRLAGLI